MNLRMDYILIGGGALLALAFFMKSKQTAKGIAPGLSAGDYKSFLQSGGGPGVLGGSPTGGYASADQYHQHVKAFGTPPPPEPFGSGYTGAALSAWGKAMAEPDPPADPGPPVANALGQQIDPMTGLPHTGQYYPGNLVTNPAIAARRMARARSPWR